jgi:hypothetical protein
VTRKDFWLIAAAFREVRGLRSRSGPTLDQLALVLGRNLKRADPAFQLGRFLLACKPEPKEGAGK